MVDLAAFFKPRLTVLDAYRILVRNGPQGGRISDTELRKTVVAGTDPVAVDAFGRLVLRGRAPRAALSRPWPASGAWARFDLGKVRIEKRKI